MKSAQKAWIATIENELARLKLALQAHDIKFTRRVVNITVWDDKEGNDPETYIIVPSRSIRLLVGDSHLACCVAKKLRAPSLDNYRTFRLTTKTMVKLEREVELTRQGK